MKTVVLTDDAAELIIILLTAHRDDLEALRRRRPSTYHKTYSKPRDALDAVELQLTNALIAQLNERYE
jgi:hypothetical protein